MTDPSGALTALAEGVWVDTAPVSIVGAPFTSTMTVLRLGDGSLLLHSPVALTPERRAAVETLGRVAHLYAPNLFHHLRIADWAAAFPQARLHAPRALTKKRPDLRIDRAHGTPEPAFDGIIDELFVPGFRLGESVLLYRPAQTLLLADLVHNVGRPPHWWAKLYSQTMGFYDRVALSKALRLAAVSDRAALRRSLDQLLALDFERMIVGHGEPVSSAAKQALGAAFSWLPARP